MSSLGRPRHSHNVRAERLGSQVSELLHQVAQGTCSPHGNEGHVIASLALLLNDDLINCMEKKKKLFHGVFSQLKNNNKLMLCFAFFLFPLFLFLLGKSGDISVTFSVCFSPHFHGNVIGFVVLFLFIYLFYYYVLNSSNS